MDVHVILAFATAAALLSLSPGPDLLFVLANGVAGGRRAGVVAALGMSTGIAVHSVAAALGLGVLIERAPESLTVVRVVGALVLAYLAVTTWRASRRHGSPVPQIEAPRRSIRRVYLMATLTNLANPKVIVFYLAFVPQFVSTDAGAWPFVVQMLVLGAVLIVVGLSVDASAGLLSGTLSERIAQRPRFRQLMERLSAVVFGGLAARLVLDTK